MLSLRSRSGSLLLYFCRRNRRRARIICRNRRNHRSRDVGCRSTFLRLDVSADIFFTQPTFITCPGNRIQFFLRNLRLPCQLKYCRRIPTFHFGSGYFRLNFRNRRSARHLGSLWSRRRFYRACGFRCFSGTFSIHIYNGNYRTYRYRIAFFKQYFHHFSGNGRRDLRTDLSSIHLEKYVVLIDHVTYLHRP